MMDDLTRQRMERLGIDEKELKRRYYERLSDWSEPDAVTGSPRAAPHAGSLLGQGGAVPQGRPRPRPASVEGQIPMVGLG